MRNVIHLYAPDSSPKFVDTFKSLLPEQTVHIALTPKDISSAKLVVFLWRKASSSPPIPLESKQKTTYVAIVSEENHTASANLVRLGTLFSYCLIDEIDAELPQIVADYHRERPNTLSVLRQVLKETSEKPDDPYTSQYVATMLVQVLGYKTAAIRIHNKKRGDFTIFRRAAAGLSEEYIKHANAVPKGTSPLLEDTVAHKQTRFEIDSRLSEDGDDRLLDHARRAGRRMIICIPLKWRGSIPGLLICTRTVPRSLNDEERILLECLADAVILDFNNYQTFEAFALLQKFERELAGYQKLKLVLDAIPRQAMQVANADAVAFCFYLAAKTTYQNKRSRHTPNLNTIIPDWEDKNNPWFELLEYVRDERKSSGMLIVRDIEDDNTDYAPLVKPLRTYFRDNEWQAFAAVRLKPEKENDALGVLLVVYPTEESLPKTDGNSGFQQLSIYCGQLTETLQRTHLMHRNEKQRKLVQAFVRATHPDSPRFTADQSVWQDLLQKIMDRTGAQEGCIILDQGDLGWKRYSKGMSSTDMDQLEQQAREQKIDLFIEKRKRDLLIAPIRVGHKQKFVGAIILRSIDAYRFDDFDGENVRDFATHIGVESLFQPFVRASETRMQNLVAAAHQLTLIRPIRNKLHEILSDAHGKLKCDVLLLFPYSPYWRRFSPVISTTVIQLSSRLFQYDKPALVAKLSTREQSGDKQIDLKTIFSAFIEREDLPISEGRILRDTAGRPVGILGIFGRKESSFRLTSPALTTLVGTLQNLINDTYGFSPIVDKLSEGLDLDLVRLHLFRNSENAWSIPVTAGELHSKNEDEDKWLKFSETLEGPLGQTVEKAAKPVEFVDHLKQHDFLYGDFAKREKIKSGGYVVLESKESEVAEDNERLGVLFFGHRTQRNWSVEEQWAIRLFANQMATAIENRRRLNQLKEESITSQGVQSTIGTILRGRFSQSKAIRSVLDEALSLTNAFFGFVALKRDGTENLHVEAFSEEKDADPKMWRETFRSIEINDKTIVGRAYLENQWQIDAYAAAPDLFMWQKFHVTCSAMAVTIRDLNRKPIGVIYMRSELDTHFNDAHLRGLLTLSNILALVINYTGEVDNSHKNAKTAWVEAWKTLITKDWLAKAYADVRAARSQLYLLTDPLNPHFIEIDQALERIASDDHLIHPPKPNDYLDDSTIVDVLVRELAQRYLSMHDLGIILDDNKLNAGDSKTSVPAEFLIIIFDKLINNAISAMEKVPGKKILTIASRVQNNQIQIEITDTGKGLSREAREQYSQIRFNKAEGDGTGWGAVVAGHILDLYGGRLMLTPKRRDGTTINVFLPIA